MRRLRRWPRRHPGQAIAVAAATAVGLRWAWLNHPAALALTASAAVIAGSLWLQHRITAKHHPARNGDNRPCGLYQHWFDERHIRPWLDAGWPRSYFGYTGISNSYADRCEQHREKAWWWPLVNTSLSTLQTWETRDLAEAAELATIARYCGVGNEIGNPRFREQAQLRAELVAYAAQVRAQQAAAVARQPYVQPVPASTATWAPRRPTRVRRQRVYGGAR